MDHKSITAYMTANTATPSSHRGPWFPSGANKLSELAEKDERSCRLHEEMVQDVIEGAWTVFNGKNCTE